jgi:hypothetical protein
VNEITRIYINFRLSELEMYLFGILLFCFYSVVSSLIFLTLLSFAAGILGLKTRQLHIGKIAFIKVQKKWILSLKNQPFRIAGSIRFKKNELDLHPLKKLFFCTVGISSSIILILILIFRPFLLPIVNPDRNFITMLKFLNVLLPVTEIVFLFSNIIPRKFGKNYYTLGYILTRKK